MKGLEQYEQMGKNGSFDGRLSTTFVDFVSITAGFIASEKSFLPVLSSSFQ